MGKNIKLNTLVPEMSEEDVKKAVEPFVLEYFENGDTEEVLFSVEELLLNIDLYQKVISQRDIGKAFDYLLRQLSDLVLDTPDACEALGNFLARAIADDCIPPKFLHSYKGLPVNTAESKAALQKADTLLS